LTKAKDKNESIICQPFLGRVNGIYGVYGIYGIYGSLGFIGHVMVVCATYDKKATIQAT
jgi:hypothetical protein